MPAGVTREAESAGRVGAAGRLVLGAGAGVGLETATVGGGVAGGVAPDDGAAGRGVVVAGAGVLAATAPVCGAART